MVGRLAPPDVLAGVLEGPGIDLQRYEPEPGRTSLVARIEGSDPDAPSLLLMGHTDVVPVSPERWRNDPFGGELIDGEVWGRGAVDMLNLTASMAVATRRLADESARDAAVAAVAHELSRAGDTDAVAAVVTTDAAAVVGADYADVGLLEDAEQEAETPETEATQAA